VRASALLLMHRQMNTMMRSGQRPRCGSEHRRRICDSNATVFISSGSTGTMTSWCCEHSILCVCSSRVGPVSFRPEGAQRLESWNQVTAVAEVSSER
jgi:hypothetical protein